MSTKASSIAFVALLLLSLLPYSPAALHEEKNRRGELSDSLFSGFFVGGADDVWNQTPWQGIAVPEGFSYESVIDYSDVGVLINNRSEESRTIGWAFVAARNISLDRVFLFNASGTPTGETINRNQFNTYFAAPFLEMLQNRSTVNGLNYLVTTKGVPLRVSGGNDKASFDQELSLLGGAYNSSIGDNYWGTHDYGPLAGKTMEPFKRSKYGFFLVTRLTGYTVDTALELIERANQSLGQRGTFVLDLATNRNTSGYQFWNDDLYTANTTLNQSMGLPVHLDEETEFLTNISNVMGYASWGSNDGNWNKNYLPNSGFDTLDTSWQSGSRYWTHSSPTVAPEDDFNWSYQTDVKQGGNGAFEAMLRTDCDQDGGKGMQGVYGEYFDNDGISFSSSSMPSLIDRSPDRIQIEPHLNRGPSYNAYPGLDDRFKSDWGARFSGLIDIPETGNWTFFINSDDGSELWVNGESLATNYGMHGMRERSGYVNLTEGLHEFRIEFFQGGGPHGLKFSWEGPNTSKAAVPTSAFYVARDLAPQASHLVHHWAFEDGAGSTALDEGSDAANMTLTGMDNTSWRACPDGTCLWYDGTNDMAKVNVDDWYGNMTVSQWVWANTTSQPTYASTFAVDDQAGSNLSFQHMISGNKWKLHNNQTRVFGDVVAQRWTHLVTVFDDGDIRQYMDGVLVNNGVYPNGSFNNIDLYKLGVNRAGNAYFEGMIDEVMVWDVALDDDDITTLRRTIIDNCTSYSGAGNNVASLETTFSVPNELMDHAWNIYVYGKREGEVNGAFRLSVEGTDNSGTVLTTNTSDTKTFTTSWASQAMRMRPDSSATEFTIKIQIDIASTATVGSLYVDSVVLRAIRPHMEWVNGSIADTAVSTGGRSFNWDTSYGQSLIADLLEDGVSGVKGYVYEPYLTAVGLPSTFLPTYASGYNLAESHAAANLYTGWMGVVVGDPKMAPYTDILHDINLVDVRAVGDINQGEASTVEVLVENLGMAASNGTLEIRTVVGGELLNQTQLNLPAGDNEGSRVTLNLTVTPSTNGWLDLRIRYLNASPEHNHANNLLSLSVDVNAPPEITDVYCSASTLSRGQYTTCSAEVDDDRGVTNVTLDWQIIGENGTLNNSRWSTLSMGALNPNRWETSLVVPTNASLGSVALQVTARDGNNMSRSTVVENITRIVDAPRTWFGPHVSGVDPPNWNNASMLPNRPAVGLYRHQASIMTVCVMDADYESNAPPPMFLTSRGTLGNITYVPQSAANLYCYTSSLTLEIGTDLDDVDIELRNEEGSLLLQRTVRVADKPPEVTVLVESTSGEPLDRVLGDGKEQVRIIVEDVDDPQTSFIGDLTLQWPGGEPVQLPLDISGTENSTIIPLQQVMLPLEAGELTLSAAGSGQHGATALASLSVPFLLTPPDIVLFEACDTNDVVQNMTFGQVATLVVGISSDRPLQSTTAQLTQSGWAINAPGMESPVWTGEEAPLPCRSTGLPSDDITVLYFRLKLDNSLVDGPGRVVFSTVDLDGLVKSQSLDLMFQHAPTTFGPIAFSQANPGLDLYTNFTVNDLDGLDRVVCAFNLYGPDDALLTQSVVPAGPEGVFSNELSYRYPLTNALANASLAVNIACMDNLQQSFFLNTTVEVGAAETCQNCNVSDQDTQGPATEEGATVITFVLPLGFLAGVLALTAWLARRRTGVVEDAAWATEESLPYVNTEEMFDSAETDDVLEEALGESLPEIVPEGWTLEDYQRWLEGPLPEGWTADQWVAYVEEAKATLEAHEAQAEG
ncbi:MAG TPA: TIGR03790 family protein [Candidatus Poseidoniales archaeon]|nr:MAG TPA: TIGR03790 family protein [Candidatus Poseidoniales archaeon]|tara:strand:- start:453 stop:5747 length:5295 start_codon:yes stop_codon:yes gene_type:complete